MGRAQRLARFEPGRDPTLRAAEEAATAAERLAAGSSDLADRMRLLRARQQLAAVRLAAQDHRGALRAAESCWALCLKLLAATDGSEDSDEVVGLIVAAMWAIVPAFEQADRELEVSEVFRVARKAAARATGPRGRQAHARLEMGRLGWEVDAFAHSRLYGGKPNMSQAHNDVRQAVETFRAHAAEGAQETLELAQMLLVKGRLEKLAGHIPEAIAAVDEALTLVTPIANEGPEFVKISDLLRAEREGLPDTGPPDLPDEHAFQRAWAELGGGADHRFPADLAAASAIAVPIASHDPRRPLAKAWHAALLVTNGQPAEAQAMAEAAIRQLGHFADDPVRAQAALVVTLRVLAAAGRRTADRATVRRAEAQSAVLRERLGDRDPALLTDLLG